MSFVAVVVLIIGFIAAMGGLVMLAPWSIDQTRPGPKRQSVDMTQVRSGVLLLLVAVAALIIALWVL